MNTNYKVVFAVLFGILAVAYVPLLISAQPDSSTVLSGLTGLSTQISAVEDNILGKLASIDTKLATLQTATGANIQAGVNTLVQLLYATIGLLAVTLLLCIVNVYLLLRKPKTKT